MINLPASDSTLKLNENRKVRKQKIEKTARDKLK